MKDILLEVSSGNKVSLLSAHLKADSFVYECIDAQGKVMSKVLYRHISAFKDMDRILGDLKNLTYDSKQLTVYGKPFLHSRKRKDDLVHKLPAFHKMPLHLDRFTGYEVHTIYGSEWLSSLCEVFQDHEIRHISNRLAYELFPNAEQALLAHVEEGQVHILYLDPDRFIFYNEFTAIEPADYLYWITLAYKALGLDKNRNNLLLSGSVMAEGEIYRLLSQYFSIVSSNTGVVTVTSDNI